MGLAGKDELHRTFGIVDHGGQALKIGQDEVGALVGGEAAGESDGQCVWTEHLAEAHESFARFVAALGLLDGSAADELEKLGFQAEVRLPEFAVIDVLNAFPDFGIARVLVPVGAEMAVVEAEHLRSEPGRNVNSVGDVADGNFVLRLAGAEAGPHGAGDFAVQGGNGIGAAREPEAEHGHAKKFLLIAGLLAAQAHEAFWRETEIVAQRTKMLFDQVGFEAVVTGRHGGVSGEDNFARYAGHGDVEADAFFLHAGADRFEHGEAAVTFVQVKNARSDAHGFQGAEAAGFE